MLCRPAKLWQPRQATLTARVCYVQVFYKNRVYRYTQYTIPDELNSFWQMRSLRELHVSHNSLFTLPTSIAQLRSLTYVDASYVTRAVQHERGTAETCGVLTSCSFTGTTTSFAWTSPYGYVALANHAPSTVLCADLAAVSRRFPGLEKFDVPEPGQQSADDHSFSVHVVDDAVVGRQLL